MRSVQVGWSCAVWICAAMLAASAGAQQDLAFQRAAHLRRGINLSMWYAQAGDYSAARLASYTTPVDFQLVRNLGFDHVRLSIDPVPLIVESKTGASDFTLDPAAMARLDATVAQITSLGLVVVLDIHPGEDWKKNTTNTAAGTSRLFRLWTLFAGHVAGTDPDKVYFELLNEPEGVDPYRWAGEQARLVALVRTAAPRHTIIATGAEWGGIDGLLQLEPVRDGNVIYSFHDYEPMEFTHQGASWAGDALKPLRGVPYPSSPEAVATLLPELPDDAARKQLNWYGQQRWSVATIQTRIGLAVAWAKQRDVPLWCGEFGVYRAFALPADRARWIADMRRTLEADGIGWNMWDYQGGFALVNKKNGKPTADPAIVQALGLTPPR